MADIAVNRNTDRAEPNIGKVGIAAAKIARTGLLCLIDADGYHDPASANAVACYGVNISPTSDMDYDNSGGLAAAQSVRFEFGKKAFFDKDATHTPTAAYFGQPGYAADNHSISYDPEDGVYVGTICEVETLGVWVLTEFNYGLKHLREIGRAYSTQTLAADTDVVLPIGFTYFPVVGSGGAIALATDLPDAADYPGRMIFIVGTNAVSTVTMQDDFGTVHLGDIDAVLGLNDHICYVSNGTKWVESYRSIGH